jgi:hypothetical protein
MAKREGFSPSNAPNGQRSLSRHRIAGELQKEFCSETRFNAGNMTRSFVKRDNSMQGAVLGEFAPLGASVELLSAALRIKDP